MCPLLPTRKPLLCYVTDRHGLPGTPGVAMDCQIQKIEQAAKAGVDWIQLREKDLSGRQWVKLTERALWLARGTSAILINDRLDVACAMKAAGVHLGEPGLPVEEAKRLRAARFAEEAFLVGASVHSLESALQAQAAGADYVILGPIFETPSKASFGRPQGLEKLHEVCGRLSIPVLAIGGVTLQSAPECVRAGAAGIAAIRLFQDAADMRVVVQVLRGGA